jgi:hypothetical protein
VRHDICCYCTATTKYYGLRVRQATERSVLLTPCVDLLAFGTGHAVEADGATVPSSGIRRQPSGNSATRNWASDHHTSLLWVSVRHWFLPRITRYNALEAAAVRQDIHRECLLQRRIGGADELCMLPPVTSCEYGLYDPFGRQRAEAARMNITVALSPLDWLLRGQGDLSE